MCLRGGVVLGVDIMQAPSLSPEEADPPFCSRWEGVRIPLREWHFYRRLYQRYRVVLGPGEFSMIVRQIRSSTAPIVRDKSGRRRMHPVKIPSANVVVFVVSNGRMPVTAWPPQCVSRNPHRRELEASTKEEAL